MDRTPSRRMERYAQVPGPRIVGTWPIARLAQRLYGGHFTDILGDGTMWLDLLNFAGKRAVVTGAASGMGAATANTLIELGAEVHALDLNKPDAAVASFEEVDLRDPAALDGAISTIGGPIH